MSWSRRRCLALVRAEAVSLDEIVDPEALAACVLEDGETLAVGVLPGGGHAQVGDGFHVLSMEPCFLLSILHSRNRKIVPFRVACRITRNVRSFLTEEPCPTPTPTSPARA